jgi:mxaJ protein
MSSLCRNVLALVACAITLPVFAVEPLRVCADPDNLPYSHEDRNGFENRIAEIVAAELRRPLEYHWLPQRRGFVRKTISARLCDVWIGVPAEFERVSTTKPYYRSSYVFVTPASDKTPLRSFDDPRLTILKIGVQLIGDDLAATPPGHALASRGAIERVAGYTIDGDVPAGQRIVQSLVAGELDAALVWGPQAGWFAKRAAVPINVDIAKPPSGFPLPFEFDIAMGVRRGDTALRDALQVAIDRRRGDINAVLAEFAVPRTDNTKTVQ